MSATDQHLPTLTYLREFDALTRLRSDASPHTEQEEIERLLRGYEEDK
jgi:hypothetical protein